MFIKVHCFLVLKQPLSELQHSRLPAKQFLEFTVYFIDEIVETREADCMEAQSDKLLSSFAFVVRRRRTELGLTQEELAHRAGVSMRYISLLETQKHQPTLDTIMGLSEGLETTMTALVSEIEDLLREG